jgi:hypothetical protein
MQYLTALGLAGVAWLSLAAPPAGPAWAAEPPAFACAEPFTAYMTAASLAAAFGEENLHTGPIVGPEGEPFEATVIYPDDQRRRLVVAWGDEDNHTRPASLAVTAPSDWAGPEGLRVDMALDEVERLNGERFRIYGFGWDYGGLAGFETGRLATLPGGCSLHLLFDPAPDASISEVIGEVLFWSDDPGMRAARPRAYEMRLRFPAEAGD